MSLVTGSTIGVWLTQVPSDIQKSRLKNLEREFREHMKNAYSSKDSPTHYKRAPALKISMESILDLSSSMRRYERAPQISPSSPATQSGLTSGSTWTESSIRSRASGSNQRRSGASKSRTEPPITFIREPGNHDGSWAWRNSDNDNSGDARSKSPADPQGSTLSLGGYPCGDIVTPGQLSCGLSVAGEAASVHSISGREDIMTVDMSETTPVSLFISPDDRRPWSEVSVAGSFCSSLSTHIMSYGTAQKYKIEMFDVEEGTQDSIELSPIGNFRIIGQTEPINIRSNESRLRKASHIRFLVFEYYQPQLIMGPNLRQRPS